MSADELRRAAALMRERAEGTTPGAQWTGGNYWITDYDPSDPSGQTAMQRLIGGMDAPDAPHYSSWHPAVALAVADWLDKAADTHECAVGLGARGLRPDEGAFVVARAYLGEAADV